MRKHGFCVPGTICLAAVTMLLCLHSPASGSLPDFGQKIHFSASAGSRLLNINQHKVRAAEYGARSLISATGLPLGAGLSLRYLRFNRHDYKQLFSLKEMDVANGYSISLDVRYWLSPGIFPGYLTAWIQYSHEVFSAYNFRGKKTSGLELKISSGSEGYQLNAGLDISISHDIALFTELSYGQQGIDNRFHKVPGDKTAYRDSRHSFDSVAVLIGLVMTL